MALFGADAAFVVPTATGLRKSIIDATSPLRMFLVENSIHDFSLQQQGQAHKVTLRIGLIGINSIEWRNLTLYRPATKDGDPRIWISSLGGYANPWNLLGLFLGPNRELYAINFSNDELRRSIDFDGSPANGVLSSQSTSDIANELKQLLIAIKAKGPIRSMRAGSTGIGFTLETLLGIKANSSKTPDYKGIEVKSGRRKLGKKSANRSNLFAKTPNWKLSRLKRGLDVLQVFGYKNKKTGRLELYCTVSTRPNPQGLYFEIDESKDYLVNYGPDVNGSPQMATIWEVNDLTDALKAKHAETFWVSAVTTKDQHGQEFFLYDRFVHTRRPLTSNFRTLLSIGVITMDYTLSLIGPGRVKDHGYIFKIPPKDLHLLFPAAVEVIL